MIQTHARSSRWLALAAATSMLVGARSLAGQTASPAPLTLLSKDGRRPVAVTLVDRQEFVSLDELASIFQLAVHEESGAITVSYKGKTIVLTPDQPLASVAGRLVSLPAAPVRRGRRWLVPVEFVNRALAPIYDQRLDLRKASHLLVLGSLRVPRVSVRYEPEGAAARLTIDATPHTPASVAQQNDRLTVTFDADALDLAIGPLPGGQGFVQTIRQRDPTTLEVDLGPKFAALRTSTQTVDVTTRTVVDLLPAAAETTPATPAAPTAPAPAAPTTSPPPELTASTAPSIRTVVIDPGHGGEDAGVRGPGGTGEKDVTLAVARRLKQIIESRLGIRVLLTRDDDRNVPIDDRAALANNNKADLFLSLHADASPRAAASGATVLCAAFDADAAAAARASLGTERLPTFGGGSRDIELVLWDLAQIRHVNQSVQFADILQQQFLGRVPLARHPLERAPLRVLESANMPAVLIELGFLSNPAQEKQLGNAAFQGIAAQAIFDAVLKFRDVLAAGRPTAMAGGTPGPPAGGRR